MKEYIPDLLLNIYSNAWLAGLLYWLPLAFCAVGYTLRTAANFRKDRARRLRARGGEPGVFYVPTDTVGSLIGRALLCVIPVANLWAGLLDLAPELFGSFFRWLGKVFDQPLVPK